MVDVDLAAVHVLHNVLQLGELDVLQDYDGMLNKIIVIRYI